MRKRTSKLSSPLDAVRSLSRRERMLAAVLLASALAGAFIILLSMRGGDPAPTQAPPGSAVPEKTVGPVKPQPGMLSANDVSPPTTATGAPSPSGGILPPMSRGTGSSTSDPDVGARLDAIGRENWKDVKSSPKGPPKPPRSSGAVKDAASRLERAGDAFQKCMSSGKVDRRSCFTASEKDITIAGTPHDLGRGITFAITSSDGHVLRLIITDGQRCRQIDSGNSCIGWLAP